MSQYTTRHYKAEPAEITRDGKQIRIVKRVEDKYRPNETEQVVVLDLDKAEELHESLGETIKRMGGR